MCAQFRPHFNLVTPLVLPELPELLQREINSFDRSLPQRVYSGKNQWRKFIYCCDTPNCALYAWVEWNVLRHVFHQGLVSTTSPTVQYDLKYYSVVLMDVFFVLGHNKWGFSQSQVFLMRNCWQFSFGRNTSRNLSFIWCSLQKWK